MAKPVKLRYTDIKLVKGPRRSFTLVLELPGGETVEMRQCLIGVGKDGPWTMPAMDKYRSNRWNGKMSKRIIEKFRDEGKLEDLTPNDWAESAGEEIC